MRVVGRIVLRECLSQEFKGDGMGFFRQRPPSRVAEQLVAAERGPDADKRRRLRNTKRLANGLLAAATALFAAATWLDGRYPGMDYVAAFAEAAMVGAVADWFAVVALFRHPLGMSFIPHTAIIPANRARIADNLGNFVQGEFFSTRHILDALARFDLAERLSQWLRDPAHAAELASLASSGLLHLVRRVDTATVRDALRGMVAANLRRMNLAALGASVIETMTHDGRHQVLLDQALSGIEGMLDKPHVRLRIETMLAEMLPLYFESLKAAGGKLAAERVVAAVQGLLGEIAADPQHELRQRFDIAVGGFIDRLRDDPSYRETIDGYLVRLGDNPAFAAYLDGLWDEGLRWLEAELSKPESSAQARIAAALAHFGELLADDPALRGWINRQVADLAPPVIERYRGRIGAFIAQKMHEWKDEEIVDKLELHIGRDLQFIRFNGTRVGGFAGLAIHAVTVWLGGA
ncbi:MAG: DUF445 domain-containing protein [Burkholderiaceae bacterium]